MTCSAAISAPRQTVKNTDTLDEFVWVTEWMPSFGKDHLRFLIDVAAMQYDALDVRPAAQFASAIDIGRSSGNLVVGDAAALTVDLGDTGTTSETRIGGYCDLSAENVDKNWVRFGFAHKISSPSLNKGIADVGMHLSLPGCGKVVGQVSGVEGHADSDDEYLWLTGWELCQDFNSVLVSFEADVDTTNTKIQPVIQTYDEHADDPSAPATLFTEQSNASQIQFIDEADVSGTTDPGGSKKPWAVRIGLRVRNTTSRQRVMVRRAMVQAKS